MNAQNKKQATLAGGMGSGFSPSATMLTGAAGVDPNKLLLGKSTLLGQ